MTEVPEGRLRNRILFWDFYLQINIGLSAQQVVQKVPEKRFLAHNIKQRITIQTQYYFNIT